MLFLPRGKVTISKGNFAFPSSCRLKTKTDFLKVKEEGRRLTSFHFLISFVRGSSGPRLGVVVSKKVEPSAVKRNRIKRLLREVFRLHKHLFKDAYDLVVVVRKNDRNFGRQEVETEILKLLKRGGLV